MRMYYGVKAWLYVAAPSSGVMTGWVGEELAGFVFYTADINALKRFVKSPITLLRLVALGATGKFGFNPLLWFDFVRWAAQHFRQPKRYQVKQNEQGVQGLDEVITWVGTVHTVESFRRIGVASALLEEVHNILAACGADHVALWVATHNEGAITLYEKLGYRKRIMVPRIGEYCWLMVKQFDGLTAAM